MSKPDNATSHLASFYDQQVRSTIPFYEVIHEQAINTVKAVVAEPKLWLDTGCGTGTLAQKALTTFPDTEFVLADPSEEMLKVAQTKLATYQGRIQFLHATTQQLPKTQTFDAITAIQSHHYLQPTERAQATAVCFDLLNPKGVYVTFENVCPFTAQGIAVGLENWRQFQLASGKDPQAVENHLQRFGTEYFPITVEEHLGVLRAAGFEVVEVLWVAYMQAGFYCIK
jgi:tRNA (cmo5U34)-methyltransferase